MLVATRNPSALYQGPLPIRSRAFTAGVVGVAVVLRYARQVWSPDPSAFASAWQWPSAPARPPRSPPRPSPTLVTKNVVTDLAPPIGRDCGTLSVPVTGPLAVPVRVSSLCPPHADRIKTAA